MQKKIYLICRLNICILVFILNGLFGCDETEDNLNTEPLHAFCGSPFETEGVCLRPWLPHLKKIPLHTIWSLSHPSAVSFQIGISYNVKDQQPIEWSDDTSISFDQAGMTKVFVKVAAYKPSDQSSNLCEGHVFSHIYDVIEEYDSGADQTGSEAIFLDDVRFIQWGETISDIRYGTHVATQFQTPDLALGKASGDAFDIVSLGRGGELTFFFEDGIANGPGPDFAIFENSFSDYFLELAKVEVSSDGLHYVSLPHAYLGESLITSFGEHESSLIYGLVGKYRAGYGSPFDLSTLAWTIEAQKGLVDLHAIHYVRIIDIIGDGQTYDSFQNPIYDPYPTEGSAGVDIEAIGIIYSSITTPCPL